VSLQFFVYITLGIALYYNKSFFFILKEEPDLVKKFGEEYKEYTNNVPRWIPRLKGWMPENGFFFDKR